MQQRLSDQQSLAKPPSMANSSPAFEITPADSQPVFFEGSKFSNETESHRLVVKKITPPPVIQVHGAHLQTLMDTKLARPTRELPMFFLCLFLSLMTTV